MIKIENVEVMGWEAAIRGMRNPMNSWDKSDGGYGCNLYGHRMQCRNCNIVDKGSCLDNRTLLLGHNDLELMMKLRNAGTDHRKFMRMITVYLDITAPLYWWKEFDTYRVGVAPNPTDIEMNSCSTMHKIGEKQFEMSDFSTEHLLPASYQALGFTIKTLNEYRDLWQGYSGFKDKHHCGKEENLDKKDYWWQMIQLLPSSYNQKRTVMLNYEVLANIYKSRKNHKLNEWVEFCKWIEGLPYSELITGASLKDVPICNEIMEEAKRRVTNEEDKDDEC